MKSKRAEIEAIADAVCAEYGVTRQALRGRTKIRAVLEPRWVAVYLCRKLTGASFWEIGHDVARYTEKSASSASMKIWKRLPGDKALAERVAKIESAVPAESVTDSVTDPRAEAAPGVD